MSVNPLTQLEGEPFTVSPEELERMLSESELLDEADTRLNKMIRIFRYRERLFLQENTFDGELLIRPMGTRQEADAFVHDRLETYERMWDGCGCKIDFNQ